MIQIDFDDNTYTCPYCEKAQAFTEKTCKVDKLGQYSEYHNGEIKNNQEYLICITPTHRDSVLAIFSLECSNPKCKKICITSVNRINHKQQDIIPLYTFRSFPNYIPSQILSDYRESCQIINISPKSAATLLRRCLQGMIRDFWGIEEKTLYLEIDKIKDKVSPAQWKAIDGLRKLGNIGAHMEKNVDTIIDIEQEEAIKLQNLIELLLDNWYVARHEEEQLYNDITQISNDKEKARKEAK